MLIMAYSLCVGGEYPVNITILLYRIYLNPFRILRNPTTPKINKGTNIFKISKSSI